MKVLKFGGSSVGSPARIRELMDIVQPRIDRGEELTIVCSAFGGVTDLLIEMSLLASKGKDKYLGLFHQFTDRHLSAAEDLLPEAHFFKIKNNLTENHQTLKELLRGIFLVREASPRTMDYVLSFGERNSNYIIAEAMQARGINAGFLDARKILVTNKDFGKARVNFSKSNKRIVQYFQERKEAVQIVTGFIAADKGGLTTTLGRGGSDYSAAILAGALDAEVLEIWTDVDGVLTTDPRKVKKAFSIPLLSYAEAMEMSHFGAKVIYPPTIQPALLKGIPIYIKNTMNPSHTGTRIHKDFDDSWESPIKGISALKDVVLVNLEGSGMMGVPGISSRFFGALSQKEINVILITQASSEHSICVAIDRKNKELAQEAIEAAFEQEIKAGFIYPPRIQDNLSVIAIVGENMKSVPGVAGKLFQSLGRNGINVIAIAQGSSELNISFVIEKSDESKALNAIHDAFFLSDARTFNLYVVGVGLIGGTLLRQIHDQVESLKSMYKVDFRVVGIANSRKMNFDDRGIDLSAWKNALESSTEVSSPEGFVQKMIEQNLPNSIFIDNTAHKEIPSLYKKILEANISVTTPNKVATSSSYASYLDLKKTARRKGVEFLYETNVGAGLPVISTIKSLMNSGDKIEKIEAVVSGSLSYIFNSYDGTTSFSDLVLKAKELGYTEPDPREDLSGQDVKRKIIILSREAGMKLEPEQVDLKPILSDEVMEAGSVEEFFVALAARNDVWKERVSRLTKENKALRFIATTSKSETSIALREVDNNDPFYTLSGADNMIVITTERYHDRPLVVKGPGAGAEVTAGGVFSDLLTIAKIS